MPLLIGGATTSRVHTAVKIAPNYADDQAVYVTDASRAVGVAQSLLGANRDAYKAKIREDYVHVAEAHARAESEKQRVPLAQARANGFKIDWAAYAPPKPTFTGTRILSSLGCRGADPLYRLDAVLPDLGTEGPLSPKFSRTRNRARPRASCSRTRRRC